MEMHKVTSSQIDSVGYEDGTLAVCFHSGKTYLYFGVPDSCYRVLKEAKSVGKYFNATIKGRYDFKPLEEEKPKPPYPEHCLHPDKCAGLTDCPRDPVCID